MDRLSPAQDEQPSQDVLIFCFRLLSVASVPAVLRFRVRVGPGSASIGGSIKVHTHAFSVGNVMEYKPVGNSRPRMARQRGKRRPQYYSTANSLGLRCKTWIFHH